MDNWYYVGHFGQLGPLQRSDIDELIACGAIERETYVWCDGMGDWLPAGSVEELSSTFGVPPSDLAGFATPPPTPRTSPRIMDDLAVPIERDLSPLGPSRKSRVAAGVLNILVPGVGRMYLGHFAVGICQLLIVGCTGGFGYLWTLIDGVVMLAGGDLTDGDGRRVR